MILIIFECTLSFWLWWVNLCSFTRLSFCFPFFQKAKFYRTVYWGTSYSFCIISAIWLILSYWEVMLWSAYRACDHKGKKQQGDDHMMDCLFCRRLVRDSRDWSKCRIRWFSGVHRLLCAFWNATGSLFIHCSERIFQLHNFYFYFMQLLCSDAQGNWCRGRRSTTGRKYGADSIKNISFWYL